MSTPTPRTDAAWNATFDSEQISAGKTARTLREHSQQLETELAALTAERDAAIARAKRAEDNLAALEQCHDDNCRGVVRIADELAKERARLDYLSTRGFEHRHHGNGDHLAFEWTISSTNELKDVSLREVIDAAMKEGA